MITMEDLRIYQDFNLLNPNQQQEIIQMLAVEFFSFKSLEEGISQFSSSLHTGKEKAFTICKKDIPIGTITYKSFEFSSISKQLFLEGEFNSENLTRLRLRSFQELLHTARFVEQYIQAVEMAYIVILEEYRGKGLSNQLFYELIKYLLLEYPNAIFFGIARGIYAQSNIQTLLTNYLLQTERNANGSLPDGRAKVVGIWIPASEASKATGYDLSVVTPDSGSGASVHILKKMGARFIGFARNVSPTWALNHKILEEGAEKIRK